LKTALALLVGIAGLSVPAIAQEKPAEDKSGRLKVVNCYDPGRNIVRRTALWKCKGDVVSDARAQEIKASRIRRAKGKLQPNKALYPGLKMRSSGSGFFVSSTGHVLTNDHVIAGCRRVSIKPTNVRKHLPATVIGSDKPDDLAVLKYSGQTVAVAKFRKPLNIRVGDKVAVIGHPLHGLVAIKPIFVTGKVRAFQEEKLQRWGRFAIDADIRRGNSGGPVIDDRGYVIGVVSAKINTPAMFQRTGEVLRDIGLIIRQDRALRFLDRFGVAYSGGDRRPALDDATLSGLAYAFVARIGCWK
jgi:serine protease Do